MENVVKEAKEIAGYFDMDLFLPEEEIVRRDREEAIEEGYKEGIEQGLKEGIKQGIEQNKIEMVKSFYNNNVSLELISKSSGLSLEELKKIIADNKNK